MSKGAKDIEQLVLGAIMTTPDEYWSVEQLLSLEAFRNEKTRAIYLAIRDLAMAGRAITRPAVAFKLDGVVDWEPDPLISALIYAANKEDHIPLEDYAAALRQNAQRSKIIELCKKAIESAEKPDVDPAMVIDRMSERTAELVRDGDIEHETTLEISVRELARKSRADGEAGGMGIHPCLHSLQDLMGTLAPGWLVLLGGGPGSGKTAFLMQQMLHSSQFAAATLFELEMDNRSLMSRSLREHTNISSREIFAGISADQEQELYLLADRLRDRRMSIIAPPKMTMGQLRSRAIAHKRQFGLDILGVDHLKLLGRASKWKTDAVSRAYENAFDLKALAKELDCVVVVLCQLTKIAREKDHPEPEMEDFYGGSLEEHADVILGMLNRREWLEKNPPRVKKGSLYDEWQSEKRLSENRIEMYRLKHRFMSARDRKFLHWDGAKSRFSDVETKHVGDLLDATGSPENELPMGGA